MPVETGAPTLEWLASNLDHALVHGDDEYAAALRTVAELALTGDEYDQMYELVYQMEQQAKITVVA